MCSNRYRYAPASRTGSGLDRPSRKVISSASSKVSAERSSQFGQASSTQVRARRPLIVGDGIRPARSRWPASPAGRPPGPSIASSQARTRSGSRRAAEPEAPAEQPHGQFRHVRGAVAIGLADPFVDQAAGGRVLDLDLADHVEDPAADVAPEGRGPSMATVPDRDDDRPLSLAVEPP